MKRADIGLGDRVAITRAHGDLPAGTTLTVIDVRAWRRADYYAVHETQGGGPADVKAIRGLAGDDRPGPIVIVRHTRPSGRTDDLAVNCKDLTPAENWPALKAERAALKAQRDAVNQTRAAAADEARQALKARREREQADARALIQRLDAVGAPGHTAQTHDARTVILLPLASAARLVRLAEIATAVGAS